MLKLFLIRNNVTMCHYVTITTTNVIRMNESDILCTFALLRKKIYFNRNDVDLIFLFHLKVLWRNWTISIDKIEYENIEHQKRYYRKTKWELTDRLMRHLTRALRYKLFFVKALSKRLQKLTIITKQL